MQIKIIQFIFPIIFSISLGILGVLVYEQQQLIYSMRTGVPIMENNNTKTGSSFIIKDERILNEENIKKIINKKNITGTISTITGNILSINTTVDDLSSYENVNTLKPFSVSLVQKTYQVKVTPSTIFKNKEFAELKVSDMLSISSDTPILSVDNFDASKIEYLDPSKFNKDHQANTIK